MIEAAKSGNVDIIDLDMAGGKAPFLLTQADVEAVLSKGVVFEIPYAPCIRDASCRRSVASNASALLRLCRGRGVVITSSARSTLEVRSPRDVTVLAALWGLKQNKAQVAQGLVMSTRAEKESGEGSLQVLKHAEERLLRLKGGNGVFVHVLPTGMLTSSSSTTTSISSVMRKNVNQSQDEKNINAAVVVSSSQADAVSLQRQQYNGGGNNEGGGNGGVTFLSSLAARGISASKKGWAVSVPPSRVSMK
jgi:ribonuclease P/MRP protein subunit RPP1